MGHPVHPKYLSGVGSPSGALRDQASKGKYPHIASQGLSSTPTVGQKPNVYIYAFMKQLIVTSRRATRQNRLVALAMRTELSRPRCQDA